MADTTQAVDPTATGMTPTTANPSTVTAPGAQDGDKDKEASQTGAAKKVEELPEWAQAEIRSLRKEAADRRKALADAEVAAKAAEEATLANQQQWQTLAEKRRGEIDALTPKAELADSLSALVAAQYEAEIKDWPQTVKDMAPSADASILVKLEWMQKAKPLALELMGDKTPQAGNGRRPTPVAPANAAKNAEAQRTQWEKKAISRYR